MDELYSHDRIAGTDLLVEMKSTSSNNNLFHCLRIDHTPTNTTAMPMPPPCQQRPTSSPAHQLTMFLTMPLTLPALAHNHQSPSHMQQDGHQPGL